MVVSQLILREVATPGLFLGIPSERSDVFCVLSKRAKKLAGDSGCVRLAHTVRKGTATSVSYGIDGTVQCRRVVIASLGNIDCNLIFQGTDAFRDNNNNTHNDDAQLTIWLVEADSDAIQQALADKDSRDSVLDIVHGLQHMLPEYMTSCTSRTLLDGLSPKDIGKLRDCIDGNSWWDAPLQERMKRHDFPGMAMVMVDCVATCRAVVHLPYLLLVQVGSPPPPPPPPPPPRKKKAAAAAVTGEFDVAAAQAEMDRRWNRMLEDWVHGDRGVVMLGKPPSLLR